MQNSREEIIAGIDPGYGRIGIAIIKNAKGNQNLIHSECFETDAKLEHAERLRLIASRLNYIFKKFNPDKIALETLLFSKNVKTALKVAEARGIILSEAARSGVEILEFNPNQVKLAVTGYGKSDKKQIVNMLEKIIKIKKDIRYDDEYDAIAVAVSCAVIHKNR